MECGVGVGDNRNQGWKVRKSKTLNVIFMLVVWIRGNKQQLTMDDYGYACHMTGDFAIICKNYSEVFMDVE